jgi:hypothetical protein
MGENKFMKSKEFLNEEEVTPYEHETLDVSAVMEILNKYCVQSRAMINAPLWRGFKNHDEDIFTAWPETGERASQNTTNHYTQLFANSPYMRGWPARNKSFICSTRASCASGYSSGFGATNIHAIFPYDHVEIAVCPDADMWDTRVSVPELDIYNQKMYMFNEILDEKFHLPDSFAKMQHVLNDPNSLASKKIIQTTGANPRTIIPILFKALHPETLGFRLISIAEFAKSPPMNRECWVGGPVVAMKMAVYERFKMAAQTQGII